MQGLRVDQMFGGGGWNQKQGAANCNHSSDMELWREQQNQLTHQ